MKTFTTLASFALLVTALSASADEKSKEFIKETAAITMKTPSINLTNPEDIDGADMARLKNIYMIESPKFIWGAPDEISMDTREFLEKIPARVTRMAPPEFIWGSPDDLNVDEIRLLKITYPDVNIEEPEVDVKVSAYLKSISANQK